MIEILLALIHTIVASVLLFLLWVISIAVGMYICDFINRKWSQLAGEDDV